MPLARRIVIEQEGRAGGRFEAHAELSYAGQLVGAGGGALVEPHARRVVRRRLEDERAAALELRELGGHLERPWAVPGPRLRELIERGAAAGWDVWYGKSALRGTAVVSADVTSGIDWFDVQLTLADDGATATFPELLAALRSGRPVVRLSDGTTAMIPSWLEARAAAFGSAPQVDGAVRFRPAEVLMVAALLDRVPDARVDAGFARLRDRLESFAG